MGTLEIVQTFLTLIFANDMAGAQALVHEDATFIAVRPESNIELPLYGEFKGPEGAAQMFTGFADVLEAGEFEIVGAFGDDANAALHGTFNHTVRENGEKFPSNWALIAKSTDGKLSFYHFYEDSDILAKAIKK